MAHAPSVRNGTGRSNGGGSRDAHAARASHLRSLLLDQIKDKDLRDIVLMMVRKAKKGDLLAAREVLDRAIGKPKQIVDWKRWPRRPTQAIKCPKTIRTSTPI